MLSNWGWGGMKFLMVVLSQSTGLEDGSRPLQTSERPLLGWEMVIFRGAEKFGTWPLLTPNLTSKAQYARARTPKLIPSTHPLTGHGFGSLQTSKRPLHGWEMVIFRGAEKFGTWPLLTPNLTSNTQYARARTLTHIPSTHPLTGHVFRLLQTSKRPILGWEPLVENFGTSGGKIWHLTSVDLMRAHARAHAHSHTPQTHAHSVGMCLGFYRPQKVLSWAENQNFKVALIFGTFASLFHGVQYCTIGLEKPSAAARPRAL